MARIKLADKREIPSIPLRQISQERIGSPYLTRVEQQHVREGELPGTKIRNLDIRQSAVVRAVTGSVASGDGVLITNNLKTNDANLMKAFIETSIFVDNDLNLAYLWPSGASVLSLPIRWSEHYNIINQTYSGLNSNQARTGHLLENVDGISHSYFIYFRWFYFVIESRNNTGAAVT